MTKDAPGGQRVDPAPAVASDAAPDPPRGSGQFETGELEALIDSALAPPAPATGATPKGDGRYTGLIIDHRYVVEALLAEGGMGLVYRCRHKILGKKLAMKIIRADMAQLPEAPQRFLIEAQAASAIGNEHIIDIIDFGALPDGAAYLVMEFLEGVPLSALVDRTAPLAPQRLAAIATQIAEGLAAAHQAGIVHRDLKPDNVFLLDRKGEDFVKILDFGVAQMAEARGNKLTQAGAVIGTPHYMSPEQCAGEAVSHQSDIYALGVMMYELASGRVPFDGQHYLAVLSQHMQDPPPPFATLTPPALVPPELERIIFKCLAKAPEQRYATMADLIGDLAKLRAVQAPLATLDAGAPTMPAGAPTLVLPVPSEHPRRASPDGAPAERAPGEPLPPDKAAPVETAVLVPLPARSARKGRARLYVGMTLLLGALIAAWGLSGLEGGARPAQVALPSGDAPPPRVSASEPAPSPLQPSPLQPSPLQPPPPAPTEPPSPQQQDPGVSPVPTSTPPASSSKAPPAARVEPPAARQPARPTRPTPGALRQPVLRRDREEFINPWPAR